ncbi:MAG: glutathione S-transferase [Betaproteobacteria bacterium RIFCSPLOWO2_12_FULL_68_20]|nr:MAG: glutathione S-transferase [Betaproteobacteria bacterium RIFCSPLOWO2_12_FULL_68_20]
MTIRMWDLAAAEPDRRFSPHCWRAKMALAHKGLEVETIPWRFTEKETIAFSGQGLVPVILDDGKEVHDSWAIGCYLDERYPERAPLFACEQAKALAYAFKFWVETAVHGPIFRGVVLDIHGSLDEKDKGYFRASREKRAGKPLEEIAANPKQAVADLRGALTPVRSALVQQPYVCGSAPAFADYILFGAFQWARAISPLRLLEPDDPVYAWRERMLDLHGGLARNAKAYPVWA